MKRFQKIVPSALATVLTVSNVGNISANDFFTEDSNLNIEQKVESSEPITLENESDNLENISSNFNLANSNTEIR